jgi:MYXO-CTERM domain-containing protein
MISSGCACAIEPRSMLTGRGALLALSGLALLLVRRRRRAN